MTKSTAALARLTDAFTVAAVWHASHTRKGTSTPYLSHLMSVSALVLEFGGDEEQAIAGLLHDAIEDVTPDIETDVEEKIAARFGSRVANIVRACTDSFEHPKPDWRVRKEKYIAHVAHMSGDSALVSACDKLHNARAILLDLHTHGLAIYDRFTGGQDGTLWYYRSLANAIATHAVNGKLPQTLSDELERTVAALEKNSASLPG